MPRLRLGIGEPPQGVNGEDYEPGMESLRSYVGTWPGAGIEFRKQYVFIHTTATSKR